MSDGRIQQAYGAFGSFLELLRIALRAILANKMRSFLTVLGIIIGVFSVVAVVSIMQGVFHSFLSQFEALGGDTLFVRANYEAYNNNLEGIRRLKFTYADTQLLAREVPQAKEVCPFLQRSDTIAYRGRDDTTQIVGTLDTFAPINSLYPELGRFLAPMDASAKKKVCVIGKDILDKLALPDECLEMEIQIGRGTYTIVGVLEKQGGSLGQSNDNVIYIPITTAIQQYGSEAADQLFVVIQVRDATKMDSAIERITQVLRRDHGLKYGEVNDFRIITRDEVLDTVKQFTTVSTLVVGAIVGITLVVGGIGIMNIMLVSVTERTREIGIRMAVGAKRVHILYQFLIESVTLSTLGGVLGLGAGAGIAHLTVWILQRSFETWPDAYIPPWVIFLSLGFAAFTGAVFGVYPAYKASRLDPIDALRYE